MAIRQYIGARYIPRFVGVYDPTQIYDALDVVDNGIGTSYIARKTVPAGTPLTDSEYWFIYGASSGAILDLQTRMGAAESNITQLDAATDRLYKLMQNFSDHVVLTVGDSYGDQSGEWADSLATMCGLDSDHFHNLCTSGSAFYGTGVEPTFLSQITNYSGDREEVTDIIVCGGLNDSTTEGVNTNLANAIAAFATYAKAEYPNAVLWLGFIGNAKDNSSVLYGRTIAKRKWACFTYKGDGRRNGFRYLNGVELALCYNEGMIASDGVHPSAVGSQEIAAAIMSCLYTGNFYLQYPAYGLGSHMTYEVYNNVGTIRTDGSKLWTIAQLDSTFRTVETLQHLYFNEACEYEATIVIAHSNQANYVTKPVRIKFEGDKVYLRINSIVGGTYETLTPGTGYSSLEVSPINLQFTFDLTSTV